MEGQVSSSHQPGHLPLLPPRGRPVNLLLRLPDPRLGLLQDECCHLHLLRWPRVGGLSDSGPLQDDREDRSQVQHHGGTDLPADPAGLLRSDQQRDLGVGVWARHRSLQHHLCRGQRLRFAHH